MLLPDRATHDSTESTVALMPVESSYPKLVGGLGTWRFRQPLHHLRNAVWPAG
ncbi:hypothetical protein ACFYVL_00130 [Streptomyces sp. NPDC004111]|uniref:hypothetical protein n=1 Tax=Streptomyces sp. NPDC004111 TaxID=3364690 RepID=UPI003679DC53